MNILAVDQGTRTGFALWEGERLESGTVRFEVKRGESPGTRYMRFNRWLDEVALGAFNPNGVPVAPGEKAVHLVEAEDKAAIITLPVNPRVQFIVYEQTHQRGGAATEVAAGFVTRIQEFCARHSIEHAAVHSATLKKWATGRGNADKELMLHAARARWPQVENDDEADALFLLAYARQELVGEAKAMSQGGR